MITNLQNPGIKNIVKLQQKSSERKKQKAFVIEGKRELSIARTCGIDIFETYICKDIYEDDPSYPIETKGHNIISVSINVYNKIAYRKDAEGIIGVARLKEKNLSDITLSSLPLILILENVEKPGNLGAILRTADAAGVDAVILCNLKTDLFNPNVIRSSLGCVFSNQVVICKNEEATDWLTNNDISIYAATPGSTIFYYDVDYNKPSAIVLGSEAEGLSKQWLKASANSINIPMYGIIDSLNVSVSSAIVVYEAIRQKNTISKYKLS